MPTILPSFRPKRHATPGWQPSDVPFMKDVEAGDLEGDPPVKPAAAAAGAAPAGHYLQAAVVIGTCVAWTVVSSVSQESKGGMYIP